MGGLGSHYLNLSLDLLGKQDFSDFEVVVSDQSNDDAVERLCALRGQDMDIRYIWNRDGKRQASANVNNAMAHASGAVLKILFQDDFLNGTDALRQIHQAMADGGKWLLCGSCVTRDGTILERPMVPRLTEKLQFGKNTVSSPSVLAMHRDCAEQFDETLTWLMDVDLYKRLWDSYRDPVVLPDPLVVNRLHESQVSASISKALRHKELRYIRAKFADSTSFRGQMEYLRQRLKAL
jgi:hypothetical protein